MTQKFDALRARNRSNLIRLQMGMSKHDVLQVMGVKTDTLVSRRAEDGAAPLRPVKRFVNNPYRVEAYTEQGQFIEVLYYYTDLKDLDGSITDDELVPVVLFDNSLVGWGWYFWDDVAATYEIRSR